MLVSGVLQLLINKKMKKLRYQKPSIKIKRIKINLFTSKRRQLDLFGNYTEGVFLATWGCLLGANMIIMSDGGEKKIEDLRTGESIIAYDFKTSRTMKDKIKDIEINEENEGGYIVINNNLKLTGNHRLWVNKLSWERCDSLRIGDILLNYRGEEIRIQKLEKIEGVFKTYNLRLEGNNHNFFAEDILIHE